MSQRSSGRTVRRSNWPIALLFFQGGVVRVVTANSRNRTRAIQGCGLEEVLEGFPFAGIKVHVLIKPCELV
jgi:hypothetical protein